MRQTMAESLDTVKRENCNLEERGITLVALIIIIVVILILVAVSINILVNSNLIDHAEKTKESYLGAIKNKENWEKIESNIPGGTKVDENKEYTIKGETRTAVIPRGFTVSGIDSERTIEEGLVIYLIPDDELENVKWDGTEKTKYDQFVWVPVTEVNKMFMCQSKTADDDCNIELVNGTPTCTNHSNSTKMAGRLYATDWGEKFNSNLTTQTYNANSSLREPAIITGNIDGTGTDYDGSNTDNNIGLTLATLQEEYNNAIKKVTVSKGFWIGRYETSGMNSSNDDIAVNIVAGKGIEDGISNVKWYRMYKQQQNYASQKSLDISTIQSTMVFGAAWDQAMIFANCEKATTSAKDDSIVTGNVETDCYKNIYDLCGNLDEWTTEAYDTRYRVGRGGLCIDSSFASFRYYYTPTYGYIYRRF